MSANININGINELEFSLPGTTTASLPSPGMVQILNAGLNGVAVNTGSYTIASSDNEKLVLFNSSSPVAAMLPQPGTNGIDEHFVIWIASIGSGVVTITPTSSTIDGSSTLPMSANQGIALFTDGTDYFSVRGIASGSGVVLETDGVLNGSQTLLNLEAGTNVTLTDGGSGNITIDVADSGPSIRFGNGTPNGTPASVVQSDSVGGSNTLAFPSSVTSGNLLIVIFSQWSGSVPSGVTDSLGTTYTQIENLTNGRELLLWAGVAAGSGANTISLSGGPGAFGVVGIMEVAGCTDTIDASATGISSPKSVTSTVADDFLLACVSGGGGAFSFSLPFTLDTQNNSFTNASIALGHCIAGAAGSYTLASSGSIDNIANIAFLSEATSVTGAEGDVYFDVTTLPYTGYVYHSGLWNEFS